MAIEGFPIYWQIDSRGRGVFTGGLVRVLGLDLLRTRLAIVLVCSVSKECTYSAGGDSIVAALAGNLEGNAVGGGVLDLKAAGGEMVEILGKELHECGLTPRVSNWLCASVVAGGVAVDEGA